MSPLLSTLATLVAATSTSKPKSSPVFLIVILGIGVLAYFFYLRPQQKKMKAQRANTSTIEVGDDILTVGGMVGTVLEIHGDRYTVLTGSTDEDGTLSGAQPTRLVFVRQAIARKIDPVVPPSADDEHGDTEHSDTEEDEDESA
jgi:preprotein translocase subunit YajC